MSSHIPPSLAIALEKLRSRRRRTEFAADKILTPAQLELRHAPSKRRATHAGRRWGKTTWLAVEYLEDSIKPPIAPLGYATLTRINSKQILWPELLRLNEEFSLGCKINLTDLIIQRPEGGPIHLMGANNEREIAKIRGKKFKKFAVDELQSMPDSVAVPLIQDIIRPTLADYDGDLALSFTPPPTRYGYAYEVGWGRLRQRWHVRGGDLSENTELPVRKLYNKTADAIFDEVLAEFGWTWEHPTFQREWLGKFVEDLEALLYAYRAEMNATEALPNASECTNVLAIDLGGPEGGDDSDALWGWGWKPHDRTLWQTWEDEGNGDIDDLVGRMRPAMEALKPIAVVMDTGGLGKKIAAQINNRYDLPEGIIPAEKTRKAEFIKLMNTDLRRGRCKIHPGSKLAAEYVRVERDPDAWKTAKLKEKKGGYHGNLCDAALYGWRWADHYMEEPKPRPKTVQEEIDDAVLAQEREDIEGKGDDADDWRNDDRRFLGV